MGPAGPFPRSVQNPTPMLPVRRLLLRDLLTLMGVTVLLVVALAWVGLREVTERRAHLQAKAGLDRIQADLQGRFALAESMGRTLEDWWTRGVVSEEDPRGADRIIYPLLLQNVQVANVGFWGPAGRGILFTRSDGNGNDATHDWSVYETKNLGGVHHMRPIRRANLVVVPEQPWAPLGFDPIGRPWYQATQRHPFPGWVDPYPFVGSHAPGLSFTCPVQSPEGSLRGVIVVDILLEDLTAEVWKVQPTPGTQALVSDPRDRALILPRAPAFQDSEARRKAFLQPITEAFLPVGYRVLQGPRDPDRIFSIVFEKVSYLCAARPLLGVPGVRWTLSIAIPRRDLSGPAQRGILLLVGLLTLGLALAAWRVHAIARRFADPLSQLARAAEKLGSGVVPTSPRTPILEIQTLGEALRHAGEALVSRHQLEQQVEHSQRLETVGTLAGGIAHDVNNQLLAIQGQLDLTREDLPPGHAALRRLGRAQDAIQRCAHMVKSLLAFTHHLKPQLRSIYLNEVVQDTASLMERVLGGRVRVLLDLAPNLPPVLGEPTQLEQVLLNLGVNARDAMPHGGTLTLRTRGPIDGPVILEVQDTGEGIPDEARPHIFEPFFTTKEVGKGTGLGLSMVFGILKAHEGTIEVESEPGKGTLFRIHLPATQAPAAQNQAPHAEPPPRVDLRGRRILVVDDEAQIRELLEDALRMEGAEVGTTCDGNEAWSALQASDFDAVISDQRMPECTGVQLLGRIRESGSQMPFILSSGHGLEGLEPVLETDLRVRLLPKPFQIKELLALLGELLEEPRPVV